MSNAVEQLPAVLPFDLKGNEVRTIKDDQDELWFVAQDVCELLDIEPADVRRSLDDDEVANLFSIQGRNISKGLRKSTVVVSEPGLYGLLFRSRKPVAREFQRWVTHVVLPTIRKTGGYIHATPEMTDQEIMERAREVAEATIASRAAKAINEDHGNTNIIDI